MQMQDKAEIEPSELHRYASELREALETVCKSRPLRTSPKSCEFLRHIVYHTLAGETDDLKERLIGMALLGRDASYDTGSDAGVRVRANDVRKRLNAYYAAEPSKLNFVFELPAGSYVPRFFRSVVAPPKEAPIAEEPNDPREHEPLPPLSLQRLAAPTLIALFLCAICLRWQIAQEHPFTTFWQSVFQDHSAMLYLPRSPAGQGQELVAMEELKAAAPLLNLAGQFHANFTLTDTIALSGSPSSVVVSIGASPGEGDELRTGPAAANAPVPAGENRLIIEATSQGRQILDSSSPNRSVAGRAALLTIANGTPRSIRIEGTDDEAIRSLVRILCERDTFPEGLADGLQDGTVTQLVFPMSPHSEAMIFHEFPPVPHTTRASAK
jgi:hypothetical protein